MNLNFLRFLNFTRIASLEFLLPLCLVFTLQFCKPLEEITTNESTFLRFENDTISFDTVFTGQVSVTRKLKVYNTSRNAVNISYIRLAGMNNSRYSLIINGLQTNQSSNLYLRGNDSLLILATVNLESNEKTVPFLVTDSILFLTNLNEQKVYLISHGLNTEYYNQDTISTNTTWDSTKARFIKRTIIVPSGITLTIEKGTKLYFVKGSGLKIAGSLVVKGDTGNKVVFQGPRLEAFYSNLPGLWNGIEFEKGSTNNFIDHAEIKNAVNGIQIGDTNNLVESDLILTNTIIKNMSGYGLKAFNTKLTAWNCLVYNCAYNGILTSEKGNYHLYNNTLAFTYSDFTRFGAALEVKEGTRSIEMVNNIVWGFGNNDIELVYKKQDNDLFKKNMVKTTDLALIKDTSNFWNLDPNFKDPKSEDAEKLSFKLDSLSPAIGKAVKLSVFENDLSGKKRGNLWDIGAYEFK